MNAYFNLTNKHARLPSKKHQDDVGLDVYGCEDVLIPPHSFRKVSSGLVFQGVKNNPEWSEPVSNEYYIRIAPRSGLALNHGIDVLAGVVDKNYRGEIGVILMNNSDQKYQVKTGDRIAQLIFEKAMLSITCVKTEDTNETERSSKGFGSSGYAEHK